MALAERRVEIRQEGARSPWIGPSFTLHAFLGSEDRGFAGKPEHKYGVDYLTAFQEGSIERVDWGVLVGIMMGLLTGRILFLISVYLRYESPNNRFRRLIAAALYNLRLNLGIKVAESKVELLFGGIVTGKAAAVW